MLPEAEYHGVSGALRGAFDLLRWVGQRVAAPLQRNDGPNKFRLSSMDTGTTTHDGSVGWVNRPPAILECPRCGTDILQHNAHDGIDCPRCVAEFSYDEFPDLQLRYMQCPVCRTKMQHGKRHPQRFDFPEWATCDGCRYHWEFKHSY